MITWLQIAHLLLQLLEKGSLLRHLAREQGKRTAVELFGSLKNMAAAVVGEPAVPALAGRGLRPNSRRLDPDPARHQLVVSGVRVCSRLGRVALGLVAIALNCPSSLSPLPFPARGWTAGPLLDACTQPVGRISQSWVAPNRSRYCPPYRRSTSATVGMGYSSISLLITAIACSWLTLVRWR